MLDKSTRCGIGYIGPLCTKNVYSDKQEDEHVLQSALLHLVPDTSAKHFQIVLKSLYLEEVGHD